MSKFKDFNDLKKKSISIGQDENIILLALPRRKAS